MVYRFTKYCASSVSFSLLFGFLLGLALAPGWLSSILQCRTLILSLNTYSFLVYLLCDFSVAGFYRKPCVSLFIPQPLCSFLNASFTLLQFWTSCLHFRKSLSNLQSFSFSYSLTRVRSLCFHDIFSRCSAVPTVFISYRSSILPNPVPPSLLCTYSLPISLAT